LQQAPQKLSTEFLWLVWLIVCPYFGRGFWYAIEAEKIALKLKVGMCGAG